MNQDGVRYQLQEVPALALRIFEALLTRESGSRDFRQFGRDNRQVLVFLSSMPVCILRE